MCYSLRSGSACSQRTEWRHDAWVVANGLTVAELALRIGRGEDFTREMLEDWLERGIAEEQRGRWRLTADGFDNYGRAVLDAEMDAA